MCYHIRVSIRPVRKVRSKMSKLFFRLLPAALSYLVLRVCLTLARLLSDGRGPLDGAVIYILAAGLGYAAAIYLLRRLCTHDTDAAEFQPEIIAEGAAIDVDGTAAAAGTVQGAADVCVPAGDGAAAEAVRSELDRRGERDEHRQQGERKHPARLLPRRLILTAAATVLLLLLSYLCSLLPGGNYSPAEQTSLASGARLSLPFAALLLRSAVFPAVCEELYYRRSLSDAIASVGAGRFTACICAALLFAVSHTGGGVSSVLLAGISSLILSALRTCSKSIACPIAAHLIYNSTVLIAANI